MTEKEILQIDNMIYLIRGQRVMIDSDLAKIYGVETKRLKEQERFKLIFQLLELLQNLEVFWQWNHH